MMQTVKIDVEKLLQEGRTVRVFPEGYSMYPMLVPGRDEAVIGPVPPGELRRGDVVLYRRDSGRLVLHRMVKKDARGFYMVGDNQAEIEGPLAQEQIKGVLTAFVRKGRVISVENPCYRLFAGLWLFLRPLRPPIMQTGAFFKRMFGKLF